MRRRAEKEHGFHDVFPSFFAAAKGKKRIGIIFKVTGNCSSADENRYSGAPARPVPRKGLEAVIKIGTDQNQLGSGQKCGVLLQKQVDFLASPTDNRASVRDCSKAKDIPQDSAVRTGWRVRASIPLQKSKRGYPLPQMRQTDRRRNGYSPPDRRPHPWNRISPGAAGR